MELEFLRDGSPDCPIVSLSPSAPLESRKLYKALDKLTSGTKKRIAMHALPVISPVDGCELFALTGQLNLGVIRLKEENAFEWTLTPES